MNVLCLQTDLSNFQLDTPDVGAFDRATSSLVFESYNGGRDSKERMSQVRQAETANLRNNHIFFVRVFLLLFKMHLPSPSLWCSLTMDPKTWTWRRRLWGWGRQRSARCSLSSPRLMREGLMVKACHLMEEWGKSSWSMRLVLTASLGMLRSLKRVTVCEEETIWEIYSGHFMNNQWAFV